MNTKTKAVVASAIVILLALTAVSGVTYSWFSDTEKTDITVSTAKVDYTVAFTGTNEATSDIGTTMTGSGGSYTISNLAANANFKVAMTITNDSTIKTLYKVVVTVSNTGTMTEYDLANIEIYSGDSKIGTAYEASTSGSLTIKDYGTATVAAATAPTDAPTIYIKTPKTYGGDPDDPVVAFKTGTPTDVKKESEYNSDTGYTVWSADTEKSGLTITIKVIAVQGDYTST